MFNEVESPFGIESEDEAKQLILFKVPLEYDVVADVDMSYGATDWMIEKYAKVLEFK